MDIKDTLKEIFLDNKGNYFFQSEDTAILMNCNKKIVLLKELSNGKISVFTLGTTEEFDIDVIDSIEDLKSKLFKI
jgi:hypothetical protein